ncbi:MAG: protein kinase [Oscillospiraceae bacterium]|nr:protein kinase [Oscillospiraceae bacterium]
MLVCKNCKKEYDEKLAQDICPYCGHMQTEEEHTSSLWDTDSPEDDTEQLPVQGKDSRRLPLGTVLNGRYEVGEVLGIGGFGITYKVWDTQTAVVKVAKEYFQHGVVNRIPGTTEVIIAATRKKEEFEYGKKRFLDEARIVAKFGSDAIVRIDDYFEENNTAYMIMEYLDFQTLDKYISEQKRPLSAAEVINLGVRICEALEEIHKEDVIHRDIAPDNIFIKSTGEVKIIDFGSARLFKKDTDDRLIAIKPGFAPPEQYELIDIRNDRQQAWTDIYALGATMYMALTGHRPMESTDRRITADKNGDCLPEPIKINKNIPEFLNNAVMTAMAVDIPDRFKNAAELKAALLQEKKIFSVAEPRRRKKRRRTAGIGISIAAALLLAVMGWQIYQAKQESAVLQPADISVWYSLPENEEQAELKENAFRAIKDELMSSDKFADVELQLKGIPESEYEAELAVAYSSDRMPSVYESGDFGAEYAAEALDISSVLGDLDRDQCYYVGEYMKNGGDPGRLPTGINIPIVYVNTALAADFTGEETIDSGEALFNAVDGSMPVPVSIKDSVWAIYENNLAITEEQAAYMTYTKEDFLNSKSIVYCSDSSDYYAVRDALPGNFKMVGLASEDGRVYCTFANYWSAADGTADENAAAKAFIEYLFSNFAQDQLYLQTNMPGLPVEKAAFSEYSDVRRIFEDMLSDPAKYTFISE